MKLKVISCGIYKKYIENLIELDSSFDYDFTYFEIESHNEPELLKDQLQNEINNSIEYDKILLLYGICGNSINGVKAVHQDIIVPKVHDCGHILFGGIDQYNKVFENRLSKAWRCSSHLTRQSHTVDQTLHPKYIELVNQYGEDNGEYLFSMLYPESDKQVYLSFNITDESNQDGDEVVIGDIDFLDKIVNLISDRLLIVHPGESIKPMYDLNEVLTKE